MDIQQPDRGLEFTGSHRDLFLLGFTSLRTATQGALLLTRTIQQWESLLDWIIKTMTFTLLTFSEILIGLLQQYQLDKEARAVSGHDSHERTSVIQATRN